MALIQDLHANAAAWALLADQEEADAAAYMPSGEESLDALRTTRDQWRAAAFAAKDRREALLARLDDLAHQATAAAEKLQGTATKAQTLARQYLAAGATADANEAEALARESLAAAYIITEAYSTAVDAAAAEGPAFRRLAATGEALAAVFGSRAQGAEDAQQTRGAVAELFSAAGAALGGLAGLAILAIGGALAWRLLRARR